MMRKNKFLRGGVTLAVSLSMAAGVTLGNYLMQYLLQRFAVPRNVPAEAAE